MLVGRRGLIVPRLPACRTDLRGGPAVQELACLALASQLKYRSLKDPKLAPDAERLVERADEKYADGKAPSAARWATGRRVNCSNSASWPSA
jgi:hypothetical protein